MSRDRQSQARCLLVESTAKDDGAARSGYSGARMRKPQ